MERPETPDNQALRSDTLLSDILNVLKRIEGHLQVQHDRINELDTKLNDFIAEDVQSWSQSAQIINSHPLRIETPTRELKERRTNTFPTSPLTRHGLGLGRNNRSGSVQSIYVPGSLDTSRSAEKWHQGHLTEHSNDPGSPHNDFPRKNIIRESPTRTSNGIRETGIDTRRGTESSLLPPISQSDHSAHDRQSDELESYTKFPPPDSWIITRSQGRVLQIKYGTEDAQNLWKKYLGDSWTIPPDGRVEMTFQQHILERLDETQVSSLLETLQDVSSQLEYRRSRDFAKRGGFKVTDYEFDPNFEESVAEYRADIPIGKFRKRPVKRTAAKNVIYGAKTAPWKRIIEIRGLSKKLIDEHETWTSNFRDPWNEGLPVVNPICPFLTNRIDESSYSQKGYTGMRTVHEALIHHQQCWRRPPPCDDNLCFHITFYELVNMAHDDELEGEIWRSGRLHSDDENELNTLFGVTTRRIRESACTLVVVPDPELSQFWTMLYMCPNSFELYDKTHNFEQYDTILNVIKGQDATGALEAMIYLNIRTILEKWEKIAEYFTWLLGHKDTLSDPDAHDSLLFDDDSFSRSRRYFWAINYLAELDISISENILQLDKFVKANIALRKQLSQLQYLRERIRDQRREAIALRDGLFSASGVMESRASTRLGENIKLLTFVSIFFLPLSFCMSIWSINNTIFSLKALLVVVLLVGLGTYLLVFNLDNVVDFCSRVYGKRKLKLIEQMNQDPKWKKQGQRFGKFEPKHEKRQPSEWMLVLFILHRAYTKLDFRQRSSREGKKKGKADEEKKKGSIPFLPDFPLPEEVTQSGRAPDDQNMKTAEFRKKPSIKDSFNRLSKVFRRGALSPSDV